MKREHRIALGLGLLLAAILLLGSCKTTKCIPQTEYLTRDSIITRFHTDSVLVIERDSVLVREKGDTVFVDKVRWRIKEHVVEKVDTIYQDRNNTIVQTQVERYVPAYYHFTSWAFWVIVIIILIRIAWWAFKTFYLRR